MTTTSTEETPGQNEQPAAVAADGDGHKREAGPDQTWHTVQEAVGKFVDRVRGAGRNKE